MEAKEVKRNLGKIVHYTDEFRLIDCDFKFTACILKEDDNYQAVLQSLISKKSVLVVPLEEVQVIA